MEFRLPDEQHALILRARSGDLHAFQLLVEKHQQFVYTVAFRLLGSREEARDAAQEVFVRLWKGLGSYDPNRRFTTWLYKIAANLCCDLLRRSKRRPQLITNDADDRLLWQGDLEASISDIELAERIRLLSHDLAPRQRLVFVLRDLHELELEEISEITGLNVSTVKSNRYYARRNLRARCQKLGYLDEM